MAEFFWSSYKIFKVINKYPFKNKANLKGYLDTDLQQDDYPIWQFTASHATVCVTTQVLEGHFSNISDVFQCLELELEKNGGI